MRVRKSARDRKTEITRAALALAFELGPERVTTGLIADRLGLTQPAIYKHFSTKEDIWRAATDILCDAIADNIAGAATEPRPDARLRKLVSGRLRLLQNYHALREIMGMRDPDGAQTALRSQVLNSMAGFRQAMAGAIGEACADGTYRTDIEPGDCATLIFGVVQGLVLRLLRFRDTGDLVKDGERLLDLQLSLIAGPGER